MALLGPTRLFIFGKSCHLHCFLLSKYQKIPTYMPLLGPTRLLISEKRSYTVIRAPRLLGIPEYLQYILPTHIMSFDNIHRFKLDACLNVICYFDIFYKDLPSKSFDNFFKL